MNEKIETKELCKRCGEERKEWKIGTTGYVENFCYFYLCKDCSRELDKLRKENPNEKGGVVGLCTWGNIRFVTWVKTGKIMPYDEAIMMNWNDFGIFQFLRKLG